MSDALDAMLAAIAADAEAAEADQTDRPIPSHVKITRGSARSKVLQVRLNPDEFEALERIATKRELPVSTIARAQLLNLIAEDHAPEGDRLLELIHAATRVQTLADEVREDLRTR